MADMTITITIPDAARGDFLDAYAATYGWVNQETSGTKAAFARGIARDLVRAPLRMWRRQQAETAALATITVAEDGITSA